MRRALDTFQSRSLTGLCAACARKSISTSRAAQAAISSRTYFTTWMEPSRPLSKSAGPGRPGPSRRWLSASPATRRAPEPATDADLSSKPAHAPLPYYALFPQTLAAGPPPTGPFSIDTRALRREFLQLQAASHPDFHHAAAAASPSSSQTHSVSRRKAEALSSHINAAYKTLSSPLLRAQYLLAERYGIDLAGDEASSLTGPPDASLLGEVMAAREIIEDAGSEEELEGVRAENAERIRKCLVELESAFEREDVSAAVKETVRLRYWENIRESVEAWEDGKPVVLQH
ncbi:molecular chaperone [Gnomoniopsis smithogilvyi]|uniref:Molecular chaperone n=1 Tax=Gnomoniopsis smithogilvyi TaxID=1191159 RepID=A0A9W8Z2M1_9PEZI|nr:molecular chaperone [Gnomoniopsis smithogilvyi]